MDEAVGSWGAVRSVAAAMGSLRSAMGSLRSAMGSFETWGARLAASLDVHHGVLVAQILATATPAAAFAPTVNKLPGGAVLQTLVDGLGGWALILALAGLVLGAALWAVGSHSQNYQQSFVGKRAVLVSGLAALIVGAAPAIIDFFFHTGLHVTNPLS